MFVLSAVCLRAHLSPSRGHRADSYVAIDLNELVELRARQRTFDGAYGRTALGNLGYALTILKLFDRNEYTETLHSARGPYRLRFCLVVHIACSV